MKTRRSIWPVVTVVLMLMLMLVLVVAGCGAQEPGGPPFPEPGSSDGDGGVAWDGMGWWDLGPWRFDTGYAPQLDQGLPPDQGPTEDGEAPDESNSCEKPPVACPACASDEICSEAKGGTCVKVVTLKGPASDKEVLKEVALAYVECWGKQPSADSLCVAFDTCEMSGTLTASMVEDWVCNLSQVSDFPNSTKHSKAQDLCGCHWYGYDRADWQVATLGSGEQGLTCLSYDVNAWLYYDHLHVNRCKLYPPK